MIGIAYQLELNIQADWNTLNIKQHTIHTIQEIAKIVDGKIIGDGAQVITGLAQIEQAQSGQLTFLAKAQYQKYLKDLSGVTVLIDDKEMVSAVANVQYIVVDEVYEAWQKIKKQLYSSSEEIFGVSQKSEISESASIGENVGVGAYTVIKEGSQIGSNTVISEQVYIGANVRIGERVLIYPGVRILRDTQIGSDVIIHANAVIGSDGFGYYMKEGSYHKISQQGRVIIEDEVEIGANTCIDRASIGDTIIRRGAKLDNLIQIAHSVELGEHVAIAAQAGVSGSSKIGAGSQLGGQSGVAGHIQIAPGSRIQAQSGVSGHIKEPNRKWYGYPILEYWQYLRSYAIFKKLPQLKKRIEELEKRIGELTQREKN